MPQPDSFFMLALSHLPLAGGILYFGTGGRNAVGLRWRRTLVHESFVGLLLKRIKSIGKSKILLPIN